MYILGIESSANKLGVGILKDSVILSNERVTYIPEKEKGFIPNEAADFHRENVIGLIKRSLEISKLKMSEIDLFAYTKGPGIYKLLKVGNIVIKTLALLYDKPIIPVNHCIGHIEMGRLITGAVNPIILYASGANTQVIAYNGRRYKIFGETLDIAVGNCIDKIVRGLKLGNDPSPGYNLEQLAKKGKNYIELPYTIKGMDMSFSGILNESKKEIKKKASKEDLAFSIQETIFSILIESTERSLAFIKGNEVLIVGGVGCNVRLQEMMEKMVKSRGGKVFSMDERYCIDNGGMIAYTAYLMHTHGYKGKIEEMTVTQRFRTDEVEIIWRK